MKYLKLFGSLALTIVIFYVFNSKLGSIPPIAKFLDPSQGIWQNEKTESTTGQLHIEGLNGAVTVHYDEHLIPHLFASNDLDLYRAQGYITARHRFWQMEFQTHAAAGRLSEIIGPKALNYDRAQRRKGMVFGAENTIEIIKNSSEYYAYVEAYTEGVNAYVNSMLPKDYPVEYKLLDYSPEPWTPLKTALLLMYMTDMLCGGDYDLEYTNALNAFGKDRFDLLYPDFFDVNDPVIPSGTDWSFIDVPMTPTPLTELPRDTINDVMEKPHPNNGSNNWAVSGRKSYSGHPILANDPHLGINLPSIWFVIQLATPEHNSFGASLPGALGIISGFNNHIAWGETNATRDVKDWYKITFKDSTRNQYRYDGQWVDTKLRLEEIKIRGQQTYMDSVFYTHHGPVSYDRTFKGKGGKVGYAMKWTGHLGGDPQATFLELNAGKNYSDYEKALRHWVAPAQNFVFASTEGDIALWIQGEFPNKWKGQGKFLLDGSKPEHDWQSFIPKAFNAHTINPTRGYVSSANQHPVDTLYPYYVFNDRYGIYRNRVINSFFDTKDTFDIQDFKDLQNNNFNLKASELLPYMLSHMDISSLNDSELELLEIVKNWDFYSEIGEIAASVWDSWWRNLLVLTWDEFDREDLALKYPFTYQTIYMLKHHPNDDLMDIADTPEKEASADLFLIAFKKTAKELQEWKSDNGDYNWGSYKGAYAGHLLQALPAFSRFNLPIGGDRNTVNAADTNHGPSWRMIVEMTSPPTALGIYPGGQSGNPGSKYYDNFIDRWAAGEYINILFIQDKNGTENLMSTITLTPKP
jgi:penicillin amidase